MTTASTELRYPAHRELRPRISLVARLRHAEAIAVACWRGMLALVSVLTVLGSIYTISLYGPHPVTSGLLIGLMIICFIRFEAAVESVKRKGLPHE